MKSKITKGTEDLTQRRRCGQTIYFQNQWRFEKAFDLAQLSALKAFTFKLSEREIFRAVRSTWGPKYNI